MRYLIFSPVSRQYLDYAALLESMVIILNDDHISHHCLFLSHLCCGRSLPHLWGQEFRLQEACVGGAHTLPLQAWPCSLGNGEYMWHTLRLLDIIIYGIISNMYTMSIFSNHNEIIILIWRNLWIIENECKPEWLMQPRNECTFVSSNSMFQHQLFVLL